MLKENEPRITGIYLENFQTLRNEPVFLNFDKLCLLYGPNSSGKSAVIDALDLLKKTVDIHNGLKAGGEYNLENIYRKHETLGNHHKLKIGIEIIVGKFESYGEQKTWYESPSRESNDVHKYTFDNAYSCVVFGSGN
jgi:AAA15 family ATPase/GTPase